MVNISEVKAGMKIKAVGDWADCWKDGQVFDVYENQPGEPAIRCHDAENGGHHTLDGTANDDGELPFEVVS